MKVELAKEEIGFLLETIKYAEMDFEKKIATYPEPLRTEYYKNQRPDKLKMFGRVKTALSNAKE